MKRSCLWIICMILFGYGTAKAEQPLQAAFSINLETPQHAVTSGHAIRVKVTLRILRSCGVAYGTHKAESEYDVDVRDSKGNSPPESVSLKVLKHKYTGRPQRISLGDHNPIEEIANPGATFTEEINISGLYDVTQAGNYTLQVSRLDYDGNTWVKSNIVTIAVVPDESASPLPSIDPSPTSQAPFSVAIWLDRSTTKDTFDMDIITKNISGHVLSFHPLETVSDITASGYKLDVVDGAGNRPPEWDFGRYTNDGQVNPRSMAEKPQLLSAPINLKPGEEWWDTFHLGTLYDLSKPGEYTIQVRRWDPETKTWVSSNKITDTVAP